MKVINVVKDFTKFPSGRKSEENNRYSGEDFAEKFIIPYLLNNEKVKINLDKVI